MWLRKSRYFRAVCLAFVFACYFNLFASETFAAEWQSTRIPESWAKNFNGFAWYRCLVKVPDDWRGRDLSFFLEPVDDARELYFNGHRIGGAGEFPPEYRSGLGGKDRHQVPAESVKFGDYNLVAVRTYSQDSRGNFNVGAPVLFGGEQAIRLLGNWQWQKGDQPAWAKLDSDIVPELHFTFEQVEAADEVMRTLRKLPEEEGPLAPEASLAKLTTSADLQAELVLADPVIGQPLQISFDERGRMWIVEYRQYPDPAGLTALSRDKYLRTVYDKVPPPPPHHFKGKDRISIHTDTNGDGKFDSHKVFVDGLNLATSCAIGRGGVWVLNPPYLLFYPDADADDRPDGPPAVHLEGFGLEDSHSICNSLCWGPDGWLYAAQGSTVTGHVKNYGTEQMPVHSMGQLIWRYHPTERKYEVFAEGGGNTFGVEIDAKGRIYSGHNGGDTRGFHYVQGGYFKKGFGKHGELSNPYAFGYFPHIPHHSVPRFTHTFIIYEGDSLSGEYSGKLFGVEPLQGRVVYSKISPNGSTFKTEDVGHALKSGDSWFRPVDIKLGPDGAIYVADFYEQRIDHASHYQGRVTPESGRVYRLTAATGSKPSSYDLVNCSTEELVGALEHRNRTRRQIALRVLADRGDRRAIPLLADQLAQRTGQTALESLWGLYQLGQWNDQLAGTAMTHADPFVRLWGVRLECDDGIVSNSTLQQLQTLAREETNPEVRCQLACSVRRLPVDAGLTLIGSMLKRDSDIADPYIPLSLWWAVEHYVSDHAEAILGLVDQESLWKAKMFREVIAERLSRRFAASGLRADLLSAAALFNSVPDKQAGAILMKGFEEGMRGRSLSGIPSQLATALEQVGGGSLALRVRRGDQVAIEEALQLVANAKAPPNERSELITILGETGESRAVDVLLSVVGSGTADEVRIAAASSLGRFPQDQVANRLIELHGQLPSDVQLAAQTTLASRPTWAKQTLAAIERKQIDSSSIPSSVLNKMLLHQDPAIASSIQSIYGDSLFDQKAQQQQTIERLGGLLAVASGNPYTGKQLYGQSCGKCHMLFGMGGRVGPDLTTFQRDDVRRLLTNIVMPSLEIREGFETHVVQTDDGRALSGFIADSDPQVVVLRGVDGQSITLARDSIEAMQMTKQSVMPEGLLKDLTDEQIRDLFAYLRSSQPLP